MTEERTAKEVLKAFRVLLNETNLGAEDIYTTLEDMFSNNTSFWEKLWRDE